MNKNLDMSLLFMLDAHLYYGNNFRGLYEWLTWYVPLLNLANNLSPYVDWGPLLLTWFNFNPSMDK